MGRKVEFDLKFCNAGGDMGFAGSVAYFIVMCLGSSFIISN